MILQAQASVPYKSFKSIRIASKTIKINTKFLSREHRRMKALVRQNGLKVPAPSAQAKETQFNALVDIALDNTNIRHAVEVGCFMQHLADYRMQGDLQYRNFHDYFLAKKVTGIPKPELSSPFEAYIDGLNSSEAQGKCKLIVSNE